MSDEYVDQLLAAWDERLARVDENLLALESDPTYQMLAGRAGQRQPLDGVTRARVSPALDALNELFEHRGRLTEVLERAKEVKESAGFFDKQAKMTEVVNLLNGPSIKMGSTLMPLAKRNLLDPAAKDVAVMPEHLLAAMAHAYEVARDAVMLVSRAWATLEPLMTDLERDVDSLRKAACEVGDTQAVVGELAAIERDLAAYRVLVAKDPLGVEGSVGASMMPRIAGVRQRVDGLVASKARVVAGLAKAGDALREQARMHASALLVPEKVRAEFGITPIPACVGEDLIVGLDEWRAKIASTAHAGRWHAADVGLSRWQETWMSYVAIDAAVVRAYDDLVAKRVELSGRVSARRAQLVALGARGITFAPELMQRARNAEALLATRPTDVARAAQAVDAFEAEVVAIAGRARRV